MEEVKGACGHIAAYCKTHSVYHYNYYGGGTSTKEVK